MVVYSRYVYSLYKLPLLSSTLCVQPCTYLIPLPATYFFDLILSALRLGMFALFFACSHKCSCSVGEVLVSFYFCDGGGSGSVLPFFSSLIFRWWSENRATTTERQNSSTTAQQSASSRCFSHRRRRHHRRCGNCRYGLGRFIAFVVLVVVGIL